MSVLLPFYIFQSIQVFTYMSYNKINKIFEKESILLSSMHKTSMSLFLWCLEQAVFPRDRQFPLPLAKSLAIFFFLRIPKFSPLESWFIEKKSYFWLIELGRIWGQIKLS